MITVTGGQAIVESLYRQGVRVIFGLPGIQLYDLVDALYDHSAVKFITTRHEQAAAYMAFGFTQAGGGIGTALVVPGPGLLNSSAAVGTAFAASSPILIISGQVDSDDLAGNRGALHEGDDQLETIRPITKWASRVLDLSDIPEVIGEAFRHLSMGRPRPVEVEIPRDILAETDEVEFLDPIVYERQGADEQSIVSAAKLLASSDDPVIIAGGGAISSGCSNMLRCVAEHLQAPVFTTPQGKGAMDDRHYLSMGVPAYGSDPSNELIRASDVVLAVGTRLKGFEHGGIQQVANINIDQRDMLHTNVNGVALVGDASRTLERLMERLVALTPPRAERRGHITSMSDLIEGYRKRLEPQGSYVRAIRAAMPDDGIIVEGVTQIGYAASELYPVYEGGRYITSSYFGNLGFAYPTALGAKVACPDRAVVAVSGDGGFLYNSQELATAVQYQIGAVVVVFNDNAYGNVLRDQVTKYEGRIIGSQLHNPDFIQLSNAYGVAGVRVNSCGELEDVLRRAIESDEPALIEVPVGPMPSPW